MSSRQYIKRVWRVPKDRGPVEYLAVVICKALIKHGWPAEFRFCDHDLWAFFIECKGFSEAPDDFAQAREIAVRIVSRTYRVEVSEGFGMVCFNRRYEVTSGGFFKELKNDLSGLE